MSYLRSLHVLVIADNPDERRAYQDFLQQDDTYTYQVQACQTVTAAMQLVLQQIPDVLLLDESLADASGLDALRQIRHYIPMTQMVVLVLATQADLATAIEMMQAGAQDYLIKHKLTAAQLQHAIQAAIRQSAQAQALTAVQLSQQHLLATIALRIRQSLQLEEILATTTAEVRQFLNTDRVLVYQFQPDMSGTVVAESVLPRWSATLGLQVTDTYFQEHGAVAYQQGRKQVVEDVTQAGLTVCHVAFLQRFEVKAILVVPILVKDTLWGLLVAHHCATPRPWQVEEVSLLENLAVQMAIAIQQASAYEQAHRELAERIQIEQSLRESEARFRSTFEQAAVGIAHLSQDGRFIRANQRFCAITGYAVAELQSRTFQEITHPDDLATDVQQIRALLLGRTQTYTVERQYVRKDRTLVWINLTLSLVRSAVGEPSYLIAVIEDMTLRKQAEAERLEAAKVRLELQLLDDILDTILAGYWDMDIPHQRQYISPGFKRMFGYEDHELANSPETWKQLVFPEDLPVALASFERHVQSHGQIPYYSELRYRHKDGSTVWVICSGRVIAWDQNGNPLRLIGCHIDITKRKQAEEALERRAREIRDLYDNAPCGYHALDPDGRIININNTELAWLGYRREEVIGQSFTQFLTPAGVETFQTGYPQFKDRGWVKDLELDLVCANGTLVPVLINATAVRSDDGTYLYSRSTLFDIRDRKQAELQLRQMNEQLARTNEELLRATRLKDEFLANMSHELRTPLNAILGLSETLLDGVSGTLSEQQRQCIVTIERSGQHLLGLINDILDVAKIEAGKLELELAPVSIAHLCQSSLSFVKQQALKKHIQLNLVLPPAPGEVRLDERRLRQVLINLLTNAVKFTPMGGKVTVMVHCEPIEVNLSEPVSLWRPPAASQQEQRCPLENRYYLCISVVDTGIGISAADQAKLFQPFMQIDSKLNRHYQGTGLGLVLVKRIVDLHGGNVSLRSELGQGSCFTLRFPQLCLWEKQPTVVPEAAPSDLRLFSEPACLTEKPAAMAAIASPTATNSPVILLAEDNEANRNTFANYLQAKGYQILIAQNGREAIALNQTHHPDLILMDIQMPEVDGIEAIQTIRQDAQFATVPIIALTALSMEGDCERCLAAGANHYLSKPVRMTTLVMQVQQLLGLGIK